MPRLWTADDLDSEVNINYEPFSPHMESAAAFQAQLEGIGTRGGPCSQTMKWLAAECRGE
jgi:hypothetical protein